MSDTDSFIDEVNEEVRRDRLYFMLRRYGWIAALVVVLIVGGAAWSEYRKAQAQARAEALGDGIIAAMSQSTPEERADALEEIGAGTPASEAVVSLLAAAEAQQAGESETAHTALDRLAVNGELPEIYRQIAAFKSLVANDGGLDDAARRQQFEALAAPGAPFSLLAQEQLALMDIETGDTEAAIDRYQAVLQTAGVSSDLQQRALQVIVALGGSPDLDNLPDASN